MKQQVPNIEGRRGRVSSPSQSPAATRTRVTSRAAPPAMTPAPGITRTTTTTMAAAARRQQRAVPMPVSTRKVSTKESAEQETVEEEVVRLRGEVQALQKEVQRLLRLNADLQKGLSKAVSSSDLSQQQQANNDAATNKPKPPNVPPPPPPLRTKEIPRVPARPPPPPPPPPPRQKKQQGPLIPVNKTTAVRDTYNSLLTNKPHQHRGKGRSQHHSDIVGELQNRSKHMLSIKTDVETKAVFINDLIKKVHTSSFTDVEQVLTFVDWLDQQLSTLSDETAVLKHFNWPERKADALREAASEYRHLKHLLTEIASLTDDDGSTTTCQATLGKISGLLAKLEKNMNRLVNLRTTVMPSYKELRIPTDWMLDSGMALKMRLASVNLAKKYMKKVLKELDNRETAANGASLLAQSVRFTYRVHQFAGGLDCEAMQSFEELRRRVQMVSNP